MENEKKNIPEYMLMNVLENVNNGVLALAKHGVYPEIRPEYIQFTAGK